MFGEFGDIVASFYTYSDQMSSIQNKVCPNITEEVTRPSVDPCQAADGDAPTAMPPQLLDNQQRFSLTLT